MWIGVNPSSVGWRSHRHPAPLTPELFETIRTYRWTRIRLVVETVVLLVGLSVVAGLFDVLLLLRLRRRISSASQDQPAASDQAPRVDDRSMTRRRDPSPFGSRREGSSTFENMFWVISRDGGTSPIDAPNEHKQRIDLFQRLRAQRVVAARLVVEVLLVAGGVWLMTGLPLFLPFIGAVLLMIGSWGGIFDAIAFVRLRRSIADAWSDLARDTEAR